MTHPGKEAVRLLNITVSSGSGTGTIENQWDVARWLRVIPPSEAATYTLKFKDGDGDLMMSRNDVVGTFSEMLEMSLGIIRTIEISAASVDGNWKFKADLN